MAGNHKSGRPRKPAALKLVEGTARAGDFESARVTSHLLPVEIPEPPEFLTAPARAEWERVAPLLVRLKVLTQLDRVGLTLYCQAWADYVFARERINAAQAKHGGAAGYVMKTASGYGMMDPALAEANAAEKRVAAFGAVFGTDPASRARLLEAIQSLSAHGQGELFPEDAARAYFT